MIAAGASSVASWQNVTVEDVAARADNALATGPFGSSIGSRYFQSKGIPVIRGSNLRADGYTKLVDDGLVFVSKDKATEFQRSIVREGDLVFTCWGTINQVGLISKSAAHSEYIISNKQMKLTPDPQKADSLFLFYLFAGPDLQRTILDQSIGSSIPGFNLGQLRAMQLLLPPLSEQRAIAAALGDVDALITGLEQLIAKKRDIKQAAMQQLLNGQTRLPGFYRSANERPQKTDFGPIPSDWVLMRLGDLIDQSRSIRYGIVQPGKYEPNGRFMIRGQDYSRGWVEPSEVFRVSAPVEERYKNARVKSGDLIITIVGAGTGYVEAIPAWLDDANLTQTTARIAIDSGKAESVFVKYMLQTSVGTRQIANFLKGAAQPGLNCGDVEKFIVPLPRTIAEQRAIAAVLSDMDAEITAIEQRLEKTRALKQGMMQELLTGRTRLV